jgi:hypothetical protein
MKTKLLSFVFIFFSGSSRFKGLRGKKTKKIPPSALAYGVVGDGRKVGPT